MVFALQARLAREASAAATEGIDSVLVRADPHAPRRMRAEAARLAGLGEVWQARADEAGRGYLLFSPAEAADTDFIHQYGELINTCRDAGRIIYLSQIDADLAAATSPRPGGPAAAGRPAPEVVLPREYGNPGNRDS